MAVPTSIQERAINAVCWKFKIDKSRLKHTGKNDYDDTLLFEFAPVPPPIALTLQFDELMNFINEETRQSIIQASNPELFKKLKSFEQSYKTSYERQVLKLDRSTIRSILDEYGHHCKGRPPLYESGGRSDSYPVVDLPPVHSRGGKDPSGSF